MKFAVAGVSGRTGRVVADTLLNAGHAVRVIVRERSKAEAFVARGAEVAVADLGDASALTAALTGVDGAYLLIPPRMAPGFRAYQNATSHAILTAVEAAQVPHVVALSSFGAQLPDGNGPIAGLYPLEHGLRAIHDGDPSISATFLRAAYFVENLAGSLSMLDQGIVPGFVPIDAPIDMIATVDIGAVAAQLLAEGGHGVQIVELGGPPVTMAEVAATLSTLTGRSITAVAAPLEQLVPTFMGFGVPEEIAALYREMTDGMLSGRVTWEGGHRRLMGKTPLADVLRDLVSIPAA